MEPKKQGIIELAERNPPRKKRPSIRYSVEWDAFSKLWHVARLTTRHMHSARSMETAQLLVRAYRATEECKTMTNMETNL